MNIQKIILVAFSLLKGQVIVICPLHLSRASRIDAGLRPLERFIVAYLRSFMLFKA
jgi:hypothetical protein